MRMISPAADLHIHSCFSDGTETPDQLLERADGSLSMVSICDHDTIEAYRYIAAERLASERIAGGRTLTDGERACVLPGIEISCLLEPEYEIHLLGYFPAGFTAQFEDWAAAIAEDRTRRVRAGIESLRARGIQVRWSAIEAHAGSVGVWCRSHVSRALADIGAGTAASSIFRRFLNDGAFEKTSVTVEQAIQVVIDNGGVPVWAHPQPAMAERHVERLKACGLRGLEAFTASRRAAHIRRLCELAEREDLIVTGGSDHHGLNPKRPLGTWRLDWQRIPAVLLQCATGSDSTAAQ